MKTTTKEKEAGVWIKELKGMFFVRNRHHLYLYLASAGLNEGHFKSYQEAVNQVISKK